MEWIWLLLALIPLIPKDESCVFTEKDVTIQVDGVETVGDLTSYHKCKNIERIGK